MTKRHFCFTFFLLICFSLPLTVTAQTVNIPDPNLRAKIRDALGKTSGEDITRENMLTLTELNAQRANVTGLTGLEHATNLTHLRLNSNSISDISPVANLTNLTILLLNSNSISDVSPVANLTNLRNLQLDRNSISDISPVANLTNLTRLFLRQNSISNISPVANLTNLENLLLRQNSISDISPVTNLTNLEDLWLNDNSISDISPVANLTNLTRLLLDNNSISDISPLVENTGLERDEEVDVWGNPLNDAAFTTHIPALLNRGVAVRFDNTVNIPATNLRAKIRDALGKTSGEDITRENMLTLTRLDAQGSYITDLTGLERATNLTELFLNNTYISDISPVANLTNLTILQLNQNFISDISPVANLTNLEELWLNNNSISDISPVANLTNLTILQLNQNSISDISPVANLTNLTILQLNQNSISDISPVANLTNLTILSLKDNSISDISPLVENTGLDEVDVWGNPLNDAAFTTHIPVLLNRGVTVRFDNTVNIPDLKLRAKIENALGKTSGEDITREDMADLRRLDAEESKITDLTGLEHATNLTELSLNNGSISDISPAANLTNLNKLWLNNNSISDISPVARLNKLTNLRFDNNSISDISPVANLFNLKELSLDQNSISDISPVANLTNLEELFLNNNSISDISPVANLTNLNKLWLNDNSISDISPVEHLFNLRDLFLNNNSISDIFAVASLPYLTTLSLNNNSISDISAVADLPYLNTLQYLTTLSLKDNTISDISAVADLPYLSGLFLNNNAIFDISPLVENIGLERDDVVDVRGNPLNDAAINTHIPTLQDRGVAVQFDNRIVQPEGTAQTVKIPDPKLRAKIENALGKTSGETITTADMVTLTRLDAEESNITDLTGLEHATNLTILRLNNNDISDISSLVANTGLGDGDNISLYTNPLSYQSIYTHIPALQERGIEVGFDNRTPQRVRIVSGDDQQGLPGAALEKPFVVEVEDQNGVAFQGVPVTFAVTGGDGTLSTTSTATDATGRAETTLTLGTAPSTNTVRVIVEGNSEAVAILTIDAERTPKFTLFIPAGTHIIHIPLAVNQINGEDRTIETVGDLYNALGDAVNFIITIGKDGSWITYYGNESTGSMADAPIGGDTGLIAVMNSAATLELVGGALGTAGTAQITLRSGNNLVGVPLQPATGFNMISDLLVGGVGAIAVSKTDGNGFLAIREPGDLGDGPIVGGVGYLVVYLELEAASISIIGSAW